VKFCESGTSFNISLIKQHSSFLLLLSRVRSHLNISSSLFERSLPPKGFLILNSELEKSGNTYSLLWTLLHCSLISSCWLSSMSSASRTSQGNSPEIWLAPLFHFLNSKVALVLRRWIALPFFFSSLKRTYLIQKRRSEVGQACHLRFWSFDLLGYLHEQVWLPETFWWFSSHTLDNW